MSMCFWIHRNKPPCGFLLGLFGPRQQRRGFPIVSYINLRFSHACCKREEGNWIKRIPSASLPPQTGHGWTKEGLQRRVFITCKTWEVDLSCCWVVTWRGNSEGGQKCLTLVALLGKPPKLCPQGGGKNEEVRPGFVPVVIHQNFLPSMVSLFSRQVDNWTFYGYCSFDFLVDHGFSSHRCSARSIEPGVRNWDPAKPSSGPALWPSRSPNLRFFQDYRQGPNPVSPAGSEALWLQLERNKGRLKGQVLRRWWWWWCG